jgi:ligand-binding sensor domain-containing protein
MKQFLLCLSLISIAFLSAKGQEWQDFTSQARVKNMYLSGDMAYVSTMGGMVVYNMTTGQHTLYTKANSGLSSDAVEDIKTDDMGNIWIGTYDAGVTVYDGQTWKIYNSKNSPLPGDIVLSLAIDKDNNKWIGTNKGLVKISDNGWTIYNSMTSPMTDDDIWAMDIDNEGSLWLGCVTGSYRLKNEQWTDFSSQIPMYGVNGMKCMPDGEVFNCGLGGVFLYKDSAWKDLSVNGPEGLRNARKALRAADGSIWVATDYNGLYRFDGNTWTGGTGSPGPFGNNGTIGLDAQGNLLAASSKGISRFVNNAWQEVYEADPSLYDNYVRAVASDLAGTIWVAHTGAVSTYNGKTWNYLTPDNSLLPPGIIYHIRAEKPGAVWLCTSGGLVRAEGDNWKIFNRINTAFNTNEILDIAFDSKGLVWVSHDNGLSCYDGKTWQYFNKPIQFTEYERGTVLAIDHNDVVWMGTNAGNMYSFANKKWTRYSADDNSFPGGYIMDLTVDKAGTVWAATWGNNACYFDGSSWAVLPGNSSTPSASAILSARNGVLWTGSSYPAVLTGYSGADIYRSYSNGNSPISGRTVNALTQDEKGNIWIGTSSGLVMYSDGTTTGIPGPIKNDLSVSIYPNPAKEKVSVDLAMQKAGQVDIAIFDLTGKTLIHTSNTIPAGKQVIAIETSSLSAGSYIIQIRQGNSIARQKLVVLP